MQSCCSPRRVEMMAVVLAAILITSILVVLFLFNYPSFARQRVIDAVIFKNGSQALERFRTTAEIENLRMSFYVYSVTNADDVVASGSKINLQEIGPFVYSELKTKEFLVNDQINGFITYKLRTRYVLDKNLSVADPSKVLITWPNVPLIVARKFIDDLPFLERKLIEFQINMAIKKLDEKPFITDTVSNFLFDGSKRKLFAYLQSLDKLKIINPWPLVDNRFGLLYGKNNTWNPVTDRNITSTIGFGTNQTTKDLDQFVALNGSSTMPFWHETPSTCNQIGGTSGEFFPPFIGDTHNLQVFALNLCRKLQIQFLQQQFVSNIKANLYTLDPQSLKSGFKNPQNMCYCLARTIDGDPKEECQLDGLIDLATCAQPNVVGSGAHFIHGSSELVSRVSGLAPPNNSVHDIKIFVEPNTGLSIQVWVPFQINIRLERGGFNIFKFFKDSKPLIVPLLWVVESSELTDTQASMLRNRLLLLDSWLVMIVLGGTIIFVVSIIAAASIIFIRYRKSRYVPIGVEVEPTETDPLLGSRNSPNDG